MDVEMTKLLMSKWPNYLNHRTENYLFTLYYTTTSSGPIHYLINYHYSYTSNIHIQFIHQLILTHLTIPATDAVEKNFYSSQNLHYTDIDISDYIN